MLAAISFNGKGRLAAAFQLALSAVAFLVLLWVVTTVVLAIVQGTLAGATAAPLALLTAAGLYAMGHLTRIVRLALLIGNARLSIRELASFHLFTAGVALGTPFRLGDLYRAVELGRVTGGTIHGLTFVWLERLFDAAFILPVLVLVILLSSNGAAPNALALYGGITAFTLIFVVASILLVALLPDNLRRVGTYMIRRHDAAWTIWALRLIDDARATMRRIPFLLRGKIASLAALTLLVWFCEIAGFAVVMLAWQPEANPLGGLFAFLSQTTTGGTLPDMLGQGGLLGPAERVYLAAGQISLAFVAVVAALHYYGSRVRRRP